MPLLKEVENGTDGLVGVTEAGDRVLLGAPRIRLLVHELNRPGYLIPMVNEKERLKESARKDPDEYYQIGDVREAGSKPIVAGIPYNTFPLRKTTTGNPLHFD